MAINTTPDKGANAAKPAAAKTEAKAKATAEAQVAAANEAAPVENLSVLSNTIAYVGAVVDPTSTDLKTIDGGKVNGHTIIGYRFVALKDATIPDLGLGDDCKTNRLSYKQKATRKVKAGEEFALTIAETAFLLAPAEYNGRLTGRTEDGRGVSVTASYTPKKKADSLADSAVNFNFSLRASDTGETVYTDPQDGFKAARLEVPTNGEKSATRWQREPLDGIYAKFAPLTVKASRKAAGTTSTSSAPARDNNAAAFLGLFLQEK